MDINLTKHSVKTENILFCDSAELAPQGEIAPQSGSVPKKILKCCTSSAVTSTVLSDRTLTVEGTVSLCIIYLDEDDALKSHEHLLPFLKTFEADKDLSGGKVSAETREERLTAELTNDGSIIVRGSVKLSVCVVRAQEDEFICDIDSKNIEQLHGTEEVTISLGQGEKNLIVEEEISIGNGQPSVGQLIRHKATAIIDEVKVISDKVMVKGNVRIYALYLPEEGTRPQSFEDGFPFSQLVDVEGITEDCRCESKVNLLFSDLTPIADGGDEIRRFSVAIKLNVTVKAYCEAEIPTLLDAYSTRSGCKVERKEFCFKRMRERVNEHFISTKTLEFTDGSIGSVIDMWCDISKYSHRFEAGELKLFGTATVNLLVYDCDGIPACYERMIELEYAHPLEKPLYDPEATMSLTVAHSSYTITGANTVSISVEPRVDMTLYENSKRMLLTDLIEEENTEKLPQNSSIVLYFAEAGETLWDIARRYNSSVMEIKTLNSITEDTLSAPHKFIIPTK